MIGPAFLLATATSWAVPPANISNEPVLIDMVQNNPGDPIGWGRSKYMDPFVLKGLGYTGQTSTGEMSGTQAVDFSSLGHDFFPARSPQRLWLDAYGKGVKRYIKATKASGLKAYFFVDLLVFPTFVIDAFPNATDGHGKLVWNEASRALLQVLADETFAMFPECDGWIVRTGETYVFDTPYHKGNSPSTGSTGLWVSFISALRQMVCEKHQKQLFFRSWFNWKSEAATYLEISDQIEPHPLLYFSIKHSPGDFTRPAGFNEQLGVGRHAQIVEVQLQREYEGKGAYPNYVMNGIIEGFPEMPVKKGLSHIIASPQIKGLWTWTRGGGWWGPYIHGNEQWIDLHAHVLMEWWRAGGSISEEQAFRKVVPELFQGCDAGECVEAFRNLSMSSADVVLLGQWGRVATCGHWMRDDRIGGLDQTQQCWQGLGSDPKKWKVSLAEKEWARDMSAYLLNLFGTKIQPRLKDWQMAKSIEVSIMYGLHLYTVVAAGWRLLGQAYRQEHHMPDWVNSTCMPAALSAYDSAFAGYRAFGLAEQSAASLYHPYYLCLGTTCNNAFDPPPEDFHARSIKDRNAYGIGHSVDGLRPPGDGAMMIGGRRQEPGADESLDCGYIAVPANGSLPAAARLGDRPRARGEPDRPAARRSQDGSAQPTVICRAWPTERGYGCSEAYGNWFQLSKDSATEACEEMCKAGARASGLRELCCYVSTTGCWYKPASVSFRFGTGDGRSTNCSFGENVLAPFADGRTGKAAAA